MRRRASDGRLTAGFFSFVARLDAMRLARLSCLCVRAIACAKTFLLNGPILTSHPSTPAAHQTTSWQFVLAQRYSYQPDSPRIVPGTASRK